MADHSHSNHRSGGGGAGHWALIGFALIAGYFLLTEHRAHVIQYLPFLLVLACPLLHLFHGHGGHGGHRSDTDERTAAGNEPPEDSKTPGAKKHAGGCH